MKQKFLSISMIVFMLLLLCGCSRTVSTETISQDLILKNPKISIVGTWEIPGESVSITCNEDGSYTTDNMQKLKGTYTYLSKNPYFTISDVLGELEYVTFINDKEEEVLMSAVLPDLMITYDIKNSKEQYFFRRGRQPVQLDDFTGVWRDASGNEYILELYTNYMYFSNHEEGTFSYRTEGDTTYITTSLDGREEEYIVLRYENYLFLYQQDGRMFFYTKQD